MAHILCTGGAGYIGSHTVVKLVENGFKVSVMDNLYNSNPKVMCRIKEITGYDIPLFQIDMCDADAVDKLFAEQKFAGVIHFAGLKAVGESVAKPLFYYENNINGTLNIVTSMIKHGCNAMVFSSSATVYKPCEEPIDEEKPLGCSNPYGWTKYMIEQMLMDTAKAHRQLKIKLLRYFNPVGAHPSGKIGESPNAIPNNLMPFIQQVAVGRREALTVFGNSYNTADGTGVRDYIHVDDLAEGHICALQDALKKDGGCSVHNLGSGTGCSVLELLKAFEKACGKTLPYKIGDARPGDLATVVANPSKAERDFGWKVKRGLDDMCISAWKWQSENPYGFEDRKSDLGIEDCKSYWDIPGMKAGVLTGDLAWALLRFAKAKEFAIPAFNCTSTSTINAVLEAARLINRPIIVQFSEGGAAFIAGKSLPNNVKQASILGSVAGAHYVRSVAPAYGIPTFVHSDHCAKKLLPWFDGMLEFDEAFFERHGHPLFSSHMLDLSEEPHHENLSICKKYFQRMAKVDLILEMEIGITGGVEDGVDNSGVTKDKLYSTPEEVWQVWEALAPISEKFTIAAAFGNVHGVYKPGNVVLRPELLNEFQSYAANKLGRPKPHFFVFHGGSGSDKKHIDAARSYGVVKMNVDTDTQWAYWEGILNFYNMNENYLQGQIGNPKGLDKPNKSYYDPRKWVRESEVSMRDRVQESCRDLANVN